MLYDIEFSVWYLSDIIGIIAMILTMYDTDTYAESSICTTRFEQQIPLNYTKAFRTSSELTYAECSFCTTMVWTSSVMLNYTVQWSRGAKKHGTTLNSFDHYLYVIGSEVLNLSELKWI